SPTTAMATGAIRITPATTTRGGLPTSSSTSAGFSDAIITATAMVTTTGMVTAMGTTETAITARAAGAEAAAGAAATSRPARPGGIVRRWRAAATRRRGSRERASRPAAARARP